MQNSESTMYLEPCAKCGHGRNKHSKYGDPRCLLLVCPCLSFMSKNQALVRAAREAAKDATE